MPSSWRSKAIALLAFTFVAGAGPRTSAHRLDEYLQAAKIEIEPARTNIELELTPGVAVADAVLADIDRDRSDTISDVEAEAYAASVRSAITVDVDGTPLALEVVGTSYPEVDEVRNGSGAIRLELSAPVPALAAGPHQLRYRNDHRSDIGVYLANVLEPENQLVTLDMPRRDVDQRELIVSYVLNTNRRALSTQWVVAGLAALSVIFAGLWRLGSRRMAA